MRQVTKDGKVFVKEKIKSVKMSSKPTRVTATTGDPAHPDPRTATPNVTRIPSFKGIPSSAISASRTSKSFTTPPTQVVKKKTLARRKVLRVRKVAGAPVRPSATVLDCDGKILKPVEHRPEIKELGAQNQNANPALSCWSAFRRAGDTESVAAPKTAPPGRTVTPAVVRRPPDTVAQRRPAQLTLPLTLDETGPEPEAPATDLTKSELGIPELEHWRRMTAGERVSLLKNTFENDQCCATIKNPRSATISDTSHGGRTSRGATAVKSEAAGGGGLKGQTLRA